MKEGLLAVLHAVRSAQAANGGQPASLKAITATLRAEYARKAPSFVHNNLARLAATKHVVSAGSPLKHSMTVRAAAMHGRVVRGSRLSRRRPAQQAHPSPRAHTAQAKGHAILESTEVVEDVNVTEGDEEEVATTAPLDTAAPHAAPPPPPPVPHAAIASVAEATAAAAAPPEVRSDLLWRAASACAPI